MTYLQKARLLRPYIELAAKSLSDEDALKAVEMFPVWEIGHTYAVDDRCQYNGVLYKCLTAHTSQDSWAPDVSPSLWVRVDNPAEEWPEWIQPVGSTDSYVKDAKVSHNEKHWISDVDNNVWEPGVYGWTEVASES